MGNTSDLIPDSAKLSIEREVWLSSCEALRQVADAYSRHDLTDYFTDEDKQSVAINQAVSAMLRRLVQGSLKARPFAYEFTTGRSDSFDNYPVELDQSANTIPKKFWQVVQSQEGMAMLDWTAGDFSFEVDSSKFTENEGFAHGVQFERSGLPAVERKTPPAANGALADNPSLKKGGAPRKWDWDGASLHLAALAHHSPDGLFREDGGEPNQSDIAAHLEAWFIGTSRESPSDSQLRAYGKRFVGELNALKLLDASNPKVA